jgi:hypothetical protein
MSENQNIIPVSDTEETYFFPNVGGGTLVSVDSFKKAVSNTGETPLKGDADSTDSDHSPWFEDDEEFPDDVIRDVRSNTQLSSGLLWRADTIVSGGLVYGTTLIDDKTGEEKLIPVYDKNIADFNKRNAIHRYIREAALDYYTLWNQYARFTMNAGRDKIERIECMNSSFVRLSKQNPKTGRSDTAFVNANWSDGATSKSKETLTYPMIDPYWDAIGQARKLKKLEFIYPVVGPDYDYTYYAKPPWNSFRESLWFAVSKLIPKFKEALLKNQYTIKYHFRLSYKFWIWKFPNWERMSDKEKTESKAIALKELNDHMAGVEKSGRNIMSVDGVDSSGNSIPGLTITAVDDKIKDGMYIEDSQEAASHAYAALGIDGTLVSTVPGKGMGAGSGSDKRVAYNIFISNCKPDADLLLEPILFCYDFNGFSEPYEKAGGLKVWFRNYWITTLDQGKESQQQTK